MKYFQKTLFIIGFLGLWGVQITKAQQVYQAKSAALGQVVRDSLQKTLRRSEVFSLPTTLLHQDALKIGTDSGLEAVLELGTHRWSIHLEQNDMRAPNYRAVSMGVGGEKEESPGPVETYKGYVGDNPEHIVRVSITDKELSGFIKDETGFHFIEPLHNFVPNAKTNEHVLYEPADVVVKPGLRCGATELEDAQNSLDVPHDAPPAEANACRVVQIATEADYQFYQLRGSNSTASFAYTRSVLNQVEGIYQSTFNLDFVITYQRVWTIANDPYTDSDPGDLLVEFRDEWEDNQGSVTRDIAHLWTGRNLTGSVIGIAYVGVVCNNSARSYGLSQEYNAGLYGTTILTAYEIGHNFGARHINQEDGYTGCDGDGGIMCSGIQPNALFFFSTTRTRIDNHINNNGSCLSSCSGCIDNLFLNGNVFTNSNFPLIRQVDQTIWSTQRATQAPTYMVYLAEERIVLEPGFRVRGGARFLGRITPCVSSGEEDGALADQGKADVFRAVPKAGADALVISPNPNHGRFVLEIKPEDGLAESVLTIHNSQGEVVYSHTIHDENKLEIDFSHLPTGIYLAKWRRSEEDIVFKRILYR